MITMKRFYGKLVLDQVVHPERDMGIRIANNMVSNNILDYLELSEEYSIAEIMANEKLVGFTLVELNIRAKYGINIVAIKRANHILVSPQAIEKIEFEDVLIVIGSDADIHRFEKKELH